MAGVTEGMILDIINAYNGFLSNMPLWAQNFINLFLLVIVVVAYSNSNKINLSIRGKNVRDRFLSLIANFEDARGGGHENAVGGQIRFEDWEKFKIKFIEVF